MKPAAKSAVEMEREILLNSVNYFTNLKNLNKKER